MTLLSIASCQAGTGRGKGAECKSAHQPAAPSSRREEGMPSPTSRQPARRGRRRGLRNEEEDEEVSLTEEI